MIDKRLMYAQGQRVGFRGGGMDMGNASNQAQSASMGNSTSSNTSSNDNSNDTSNNGGGGSDNNYTYRGPADLGVTTRKVNRITAPEAYEIIGGEKFDVTPETSGDREKARVKAEIMKAPIPNFTPKGIEYFKDGKLLTNSLVPGDNPLGKPKFNLFKTVADLAIYASPYGPAYAKYNKAKALYKGAKYAKDLAQPYTTKNLNKPFEMIEGLTENIGLKDKNVIKSFKDSFTNNLTYKTKSKPVINTNTDNDSDDGIASLKKANVLQDEYSILFQKLQTGNISEAEQIRYNMLKNMLGI